jgi:hypothetical protein
MIVWIDVYLTGLIRHCRFFKSGIGDVCMGGFRALIQILAPIANIDGFDGQAIEFTSSTKKQKSGAFSFLVQHLSHHLAGFYQRRDSKLGICSVWHKEL